MATAPRFLASLQAHRDPEEIAVRDSKPWYRKSIDAWYAQVNRRQIRLVKGRDNRQEAKRKLAVLLVC